MLLKLKQPKLSALVVNTLKLSVSNILMYMLPLVVTPILSRLYNPNFFGEWGIFASTYTIIAVAMFGSYDNAIIKSKRDETYPLAFLCALCGLGCVILTIIVFFIGDQLGISYFTNFPSKYLLYCYLIIEIGIKILTNIYNREQKYTLLSIGNIIYGSSQALGRIIWGCFIKLWNGLIIGAVLSQAIQLIYLLIFTRKNKIRKLSLRDIQSVAKRYINFPKYDAPASLFHFAALNLPVIILSLSFPLNDIGCYSMIIQMLVLPISLIGSAMSRVYYQQVTAETNNNVVFSEQLHSTTLHVLRMLIFVCCLPALFIGLGGDTIIVWFLGKQWATAGNMAICLALWSVPTIFSESVKPIFRVLEKQKKLLAIETLYLLGSIIILAISNIIKFDIYFTLILYMLVCVFFKIILIHCIFKYANIKLIELPILGIFAVCLTTIIIIVRCVFIFIS